MAFFWLSKSLFSRSRLRGEARRASMIWGGSAPVTGDARHPLLSSAAEVVPLADGWEDKWHRPRIMHQSPGHAHALPLPPAAPRVAPSRCWRHRQDKQGAGLVWSDSTVFSHKCLQNFIFLTSFTKFVENFFLTYSTSGRWRDNVAHFPYTSVLIILILLLSTDLWII